MKPEVILTGLAKLYAKRKALDKQIETAEKNLVNEAKAAAKAPKGKKPAGKATAAKKSAGVKKTAKRGRKPKAAQN